MNIDTEAVWAQLEVFLKDPSDFTEGINLVLSICEKSYPHKEWDFYRRIRFEETMEQMRVLFPPQWKEILKKKEIRGVYWGITLVELEGGFLSQAIECRGSKSPLDKENPDSWLKKADWIPESNDFITESLNRLYLTANYENGLYMDAEWPLGLAFLILSMTELLREKDKELEGRPLDILFGFEEGDFLLF